MMKSPLPAQRTQRAPVQMHLQLLYFLYIISSCEAGMTKTPGTWMRDASAAKSPGCRGKGNSHGSHEQRQMYQSSLTACTLLCLPVLR